MRPQSKRRTPPEVWDELPDDFASRLRQGDNDAWALVVRELKPILDTRKSRFASRMVRESTNGIIDQDDLFAIGCDRLLSKLKNDPDFLSDGLDLLPARFAELIRRESIDIQRRFQIERSARTSAGEVTEESLKEMPDREAVDPARSAIAEETEDRLRAAVGHLDDESREILRRRFNDGEKIHVISEATARSGSAVSRLIEKAYRCLRGLLSDVDPEDLSRAASRAVRPEATPGDELECAAYAPSAVVPGGTFLLQVFAYLLDRADEATRQARQRDERAEELDAMRLRQRVARGETLTFDLDVTGGTADEKRLPLVWNGRTDAVKFLVTADREVPGSQLFGRITVSLKSVPVGRIVFKVDIAAQTSREPTLVGTADRFHSYFVSYAREDKREVIKCVRLLRSLGKDGRQDILDIEPGERWEERLQEFIRRSDVTLLFWSTHAKNSDEVRKECRYCVEVKGLDCILPVIIEKPPPEPFPELAKIHMDDRLLYFVE